MKPNTLHIIGFGVPQQKIAPPPVEPIETDGYYVTGYIEENYFETV